MPAATLIPQYDAFVTALYEAGIFGPHLYGREVAKPVLAALGVMNFRAVEAAVLQSHNAQDAEELGHVSVLGEGWGFTVLESAVQRIFARIARYEAEVGLSAIMTTAFIPYAWPVGADH